MDETGLDRDRPSYAGPRSRDQQRHALLEEVRQALESAESRRARVEDEISVLTGLRVSIERDEPVDAVELSEMIARGHFRYGRHAPKTNADVLLEMLSKHGPLKVKAMVARLADDNHRLASSANPIKAVSNELAAMRRGNLVVRLPDGSYDDAAAYEDVPF